MRRRRKPCPPPPKTKEEILNEIMENDAARKRVQEIREIAMRQVEECHVRLAAELLGIKGLHECSYRQLAELLGETASWSTLQNICNRTRYVRRRTYENLCIAVNAHRRFLDMTDVDFPPLPDHYS